MILVAGPIYFYWAQDRYRSRDNYTLLLARPIHGRETVMIQVARPLHLNVSKSVGKSDTIIDTSRPKLFINVQLRDALDVKRSFVLATTNLRSCSIVCSRA